MTNKIKTKQDIATEKIELELFLAKQKQRFEKQKENEFLKKRRMEKREILQKEEHYELEELIRIGDKISALTLAMFETSSNRDFLYYGFLIQSYTDEFNECFSEAKYGIAELYVYVSHPQSWGNPKKTVTETYKGVNI